MALVMGIQMACHKPPLREAGPFPEPVQRDLAESVELPAPPGYAITGLAEYTVEALIVSRSRYRHDREAELAPVDLLLAWGPLTREPNLTGIRWSQGGRWGQFRYEYGTLTVDQREIEQCSANTHIIPAWGDEALRGELLSLRRGDAVRLEGYLVRVRATDGNWQWNSSRRRTDTGSGACEVFYVTGWTYLN